MKQATYNRSRLEILGYILQFCLCKKYNGDISPPVDEKMVLIPNDTPPIGSLCVLSAVMPGTKWYLSWLVEHDNSRYLLKSIEDGSLCWWDNVGIAYFPTELTDAFPTWKWTDEQFEFRDRFKRACKGYYINIPENPVFNEDGSVTLKFRKRFNLGIAPPEKTFPNWRKLKSSELKAFYLESDSYKGPPTEA